MWKSLKRRGFFRPEYLLDICKGIAAALFLAFFFYRNLWAFIPMILPAGAMVLWDRKKAINRKDKRLLEQFGECVMSVGGAVKAGYAAENAFAESMKDMEMMYGPEAEILKELIRIKGGLANHLPLEDLLQEMGERTGLGEIREFAQVFAITKRNGGSLEEIIHMTAENIHSKLSVEEEIYTVLAAKRFEQKIMNTVPFFLALYIQATTPGYFDMFYEDITGRVIMTLFLVWYVMAYGLSEYILWKAVAE